MPSRKIYLFFVFLVSMLQIQSQTQASEAALLASDKANIFQTKNQYDSAAFWHKKSPPMPINQKGIEAIKCRWKRNDKSKQDLSNALATCHTALEVVS